MFFNNLIYILLFATTLVAIYFLYLFLKTKNKLEENKIDFLTKLPNKNGFLDNIKEIDSPILFYLNIDDFMALNNLYGNEVGDKVLINMANLLRDITKHEECTIYRIYNDEFLVLCQEGNVNMNNYKEFFLNLMSNIEESTISCDRERCRNCTAPECISFTLSGGVAYYEHDSDYDKLSIYAGIARNIAKLENRKFLLYNHDMQSDEDYAKNMLWIKQIRRAIVNEQFLPYFQPIIDNKTGQVVKYEALVRMINDKGKVISPFFFLDIAKRAKLYSKITRVVLDKTLEVFKEYPEYECSINLSTEDIMNKGTRAYIYNRLKSYPHTHKVVFEITESEEIRDFKTVSSFIKKVREFNAKISIDDFGTGYANFDYILNLDIDYIKIDGSLIKNIDVDEQSRIIVEAIIAFSKKLGTETIVEFVHNELVQKEVVTLGANYSQGYYIGKPRVTLI
jgi:EAL domain-containing protein (putative c-di-GMP-specific phosphodiesterase class I)/GGDEF domain-containing protein